MKLLRCAIVVAVAGMPAAVLAQADPTGMTPTGMTSSQMTPGASHSGIPDASANSIGGVDSQGLRDRMFLRRALGASAASAQLGRLALEKSGNESVKKFAQRTLDDHVTITSSLKPYADSLGLPAPEVSRQDQQAYARLSALTGSAFDQAYLECVLKSHKRDLDAYAQESGSANDPELRETVAHDQMLIARHVRAADKLAAASLAGAKPPAVVNR